MSDAVVVRGLTKHYGELVAVDGVDFDVTSGEVFGFLGPNGAGKSTTIKMLCTLVDAGLGHRPEHGSRIGESAAGELRARRLDTLEPGHVDYRTEGE